MSTNSSVLFEDSQDLSKSLVANSQALTEGRAGHPLVGEGLEDTVCKGVKLVVGVFDHIVGYTEVRFGSASEFDIHRGLGGQSSMLGVELGFSLAVEQIERAVRPCVQIAGAA